MRTADVNDTPRRRRLTPGGADVNFARRHSQIGRDVFKKSFIHIMLIPAIKGHRYVCLRLNWRLYFLIAWEQRKVGEVTEELEQYATFESGFPLLTSARSGLMFQNEYRGNASTDNQDTLFSIVPKGSCTYRHMSDDDIFHFNINEIAENGLVSREYPVFISSIGNNLFTIIQYLNWSPTFRKFCREQKMGGTRTRLYYKNLSSFELLLPAGEEQNEIASFFCNLDNLITLHQRERDDEERLVNLALILSASLCQHLGSLILVLCANRSFALLSYLHGQAYVPHSQWILRQIARVRHECASTHGLR